MIKDSFETSAIDLENCGCSPQLTKRFQLYTRENKPHEQLRLLKKQRKSLMDNLHTAQKQIECLDYIVRKLEQSL